MYEVEEIEQLLRRCLRHDEEAYQLHHAEAFGWFERVLGKADISKDRVKFAIQKVTEGEPRQPHPATPLGHVLPRQGRPSGADLEAD